MRRKTAVTAARIFFILCIPLFLFTAVIGIAFNCVRLYEYGFDTYNVENRTGLPPTELVRTAESLIAYFNSGDEYIDLTVEKDGRQFELFTREEQIHFRDVKGLVRLDYGVLLATGIYVLLYTGVSLYLRRRRRFARDILAGGGLTLALMMALWLGSLWNFDRLFYRFHLLAFSNDFWSAEGYMLKLFPGGFWYDATLFCALGIALAALVLAGTSAVYLFLTGKGLHFRRLVS